MLIYIQVFFSLVVGILGFCVIFLLLFSYNSNKIVNSYLAIAFFILSVRAIANVNLNDHNLFYYLQINVETIYSLALLVAPCLYLYFINLINDNKKWKNKNILHFIFPIVLSLYFQFSPYFKNTHHNAIIAIYKIFIILFIAIYLVLISKIYRDFFYKKQPTTTNKEHFRIIRKWLKFLLIITIIGILRLLIVLGFETYIGINFSGFSSYVIQSVLLLVLYFKILLSPEILYGYPKIRKQLAVFNECGRLNLSVWEEYLDNSENNLDLEFQKKIGKKANSYIVAIDSFVINETPFRKSEYSINDLSKDLKIPSSHLAYIFKYYCKLSFVEYKNYSKISDSLILIKNNFLDSQTLDSLAYKVGFKSYNSFYIYFKKQTNYSPKEYLSILHNNYKLEINKN